MTAAHCGNKFLIVWILYPVVLLLIFLLEEGLTCLFSLRQTADCQIPDKDIFFSPHILSGFSKSVHLLIVYSLSSHSHICPDSFLFKIQTQMSVCLHMPASWMSTAWILQGVMSVRDWSPVRLDTRSTMTFVKVHYTLSALTSINVFTYIHSEYIVNGSKGVCELLCYYNVMKLHCSSVYKPYENSPFTLKSPCNYDILSTQ